MPPPPSAPPSPPPPIVDTHVASGAELKQALLQCQTEATGLPFRIILASGEHALEQTLFDNRTAASEVWIVGETGTAIRPAHADQPLLAVFERGAPRVHISNVRLLGRLTVQGGDLRLSDCIIEGSSNETAATAIEPSPDCRALSLLAGSAVLTRTTWRHHSCGAIFVQAAQLTVVESTFWDCRASSGGAVLVGDGSFVVVAASNFTDNTATVSGGALQVDGGKVLLLNETLFERNAAASSGGSIQLSPAAKVEYTLPAPPGRWLFVRQGVSFQLDPGSENSDFPYACPAGIVGGTSVAEQTGPQCSRLW